MKHEISPYDYLDNLCGKHNIALQDIGSYAHAYSQLINRMEDIFKFATKEDVNQVLCLAYLLDPEHAKEFVNYIRRVHAGNDVFIGVEPDLTSCKLLLVTAFYQNPSFLAKAKNYIAFTKFLIRKEKRETEQNNATDFETVIIIYMTPLINRSATPAETNLYQFRDSIECKDEKYGDMGTLTLWRSQSKYTQEFMFKFRWNASVLRYRPLDIKIDFVTASDKKAHTLYLYDDPEDLDETITSTDGEGIDSTAGLEGEMKLTFTKHEEKE